MCCAICCTRSYLNEPLFREAGGGPEEEDDCSYCFAAIIVGCPKFDIGPLCFAVILRPLQHEHCPPQCQSSPRPNGSRSTETLSSLSGVKTRGAELNKFKADTAALVPGIRTP